MPYTYILYSASLDRYYIGSTRESIEERLYKHNHQHKGFTSSVNDWQIAFVEFHTDYSEALKSEKKIKKWKSRKMIEALINKNQLVQSIPTSVGGGTGSNPVAPTE